HNGAPSNSSNCAALACYNYSTATTKKSEWFLPSRAEVYELRKYVSKNFFDDGVWTSSITENNYYERTSAVYIHSSFGYSQGSRYKFYNVLPVRAFSN
ncbi:MAG: hypothetical protein IKN34_02935, partial [Treponema sp.]|nr:hypothetical protein [Treponema sp.]